MREIWRSMLAAGFGVLIIAGGAFGAAQVGSPAPDFCLLSSQADKVCLKDFKGKENIVLLFYVLDFTPG